MFLLVNHIVWLCFEHLYRIFRHYYYLPFFNSLFYKFKIILAHLVRKIKILILLL
jgi:hypothetical protein